MKELIKHIITIGKVLGALGVMTTGVLWLDGKFDKQTGDLEDIKEIVEYNNIEIGLLAERQEGFQDTLESFEAEHKEQGDKIESLGWALRNIDNFTPEQLEEILNREFARDREYNRSSEIMFIPVE